MNDTLTTHTTNAPKETLIDQFWAGEVGEVQFLETGLRLGLSSDELNSVIAEVRTEDGT